MNSEVKKRKKRLWAFCMAFVLLLVNVMPMSVLAAGIVEAPTVDVPAGTYTENKTVTLTSASTGATIYYTTDGSEPALSGGVPSGTTKAYTEPIAVTGTEGQSVQTTIKAIAVKSGMQDSTVQTFTYTIQIPDTTAPVAEIQIDEDRWSYFWSSLTFGYFFKNPKSVTVTATDNLTTDPTVEYLLADHEFTKGQLTAASVTWTDYTGGFIINANSKKIVYAKVTDEAGNSIIVNSAGIVVYTDSAADTTEITYVKNVTGDVNAKVTLNGNTVAGIQNGNNALTDGTDYTVDADGKITFKEAYLKTLAAGTYTLTVSYDPMGESYVQGDENEAANTTELALTVRVMESAAENEKKENIPFIKGENGILCR